MKHDFDIHGFPGETYRVACFDAYGELADNVIRQGTKHAIALLVTCEDNDIRFTVGDTFPTQGAGAVGHLLLANQSLRLANPRAIDTFRFINAVNGQTAVLQATAEFEIGG